jgi:hypothetical protein
VVDAGLASGLAGELVGASCDWVCVSEPGVPVLGVWDSEPVWALAGDSETGLPVLGVWDSEPVWAPAGDSETGVPVLGLWDSEPVWALAVKASIAPTAATVSKRQCLRKADTRTLTPVAHNQPPVG